MDGAQICIFFPLICVMQIRIELNSQNPVRPGWFVAELLQIESKLHPHCLSSVDMRKCIVYIDF